MGLLELAVEVSETLPDSQRSCERSERSERSPSLVARRLNDRIDRARRESWRTTAEANLLEIVRGLVSVYLARSDPLLWEVDAWLDRNLNEWKRRVAVNLP
jgi:hypothetical protein